MAPHAQDDEPLEVAHTDCNPVDLDSGDFYPSLQEKVSEYRKVHSRTIQDPDYDGDSTDFLHHGLLMLFDDELFLAPIERPGTVLDVATGNGTWAKDFAEQFPGAQVTATDLNPLEPSRAPPNVEFVVEDVNEVWSRPRDHYDFIHMRALNGVLGSHRDLYDRAFEATAPGGWVQHLEMDVAIDSDEVSFPEDHVFSRWVRDIRDAGSKMATPAIDLQQMGYYLGRAGFKDVVEIKRRVPLHTWPEDGNLADVGLCCLADLDQKADQIGFQQFVGVLGRAEDDVLPTIEDMHRELRDRSNYHWAQLTAVYGRKPE